MNKNLYILAIALFLCPVLIRAEKITTSHDFNSMASARQIEFQNSNKVGVTPFVTYTCSGSSAEFGANGSYIVSILLKKNGDQVRTTRIEELSEFVIAHEPNSKCTNIQVRVSKDSVEWSRPLSGDSINYTNGGIRVYLPRNHYFVEIKNTNSTDVNLMSITWYQDHCNCFIYEP